MPRCLSTLLATRVASVSNAVASPTGNHRGGLPHREQIRLTPPDRRVRLGPTATVLKVFCGEVLNLVSKV